MYKLASMCPTRTNPLAEALDKRLKLHLHGLIVLSVARVQPAQDTDTDTDTDTHTHTQPSTAQTHTPKEGAIAASLPHTSVARLRNASLQRAHSSSCAEGGGGGGKGRIGA